MNPPLTLTAWLRYDLIAAALDGLSGVQSVLEIGVGEGAMGARLARRYRYTGVELDARSHRKAAARIQPAGGHVLHGGFSSLPPGATFDLVCAFEVLEHIADDAATLRDWRARIRPGGWLLISVPGFRRRYGPWDERAGHYRRYEPHQLTALLQTAGFAQPRVWSYGFPLGNLTERVRHLVARRRRLRGSMEDLTRVSGRQLQPSERLGWLTWLIAAPFRVLQRPFRDTHLGVGLVALARRAD